MPTRRSLTLATLCLLFAAPQARAMQFTQEAVSPSETFVVARGPIVKGDAERLTKALGGVATGTRILALALDSPGGLVGEGEQLSATIRTRALPVVVAADRQCVSACFLLFAAAPRKFVESNALVGVHSASENGAENETTMAVSVQMARIASALGVPPAIVGKMVRTKPGAVEWLTQADLTAMGAKIYTGDIVMATREPAGTRLATPFPGTPLSTTPPPAVRPPAAPPVPVAASANLAAGFVAGRNGRLDWDAWLAGQQGGFKQGAVLAQLQSGLSGPAICRGPNGTDQGEVTSGCEAALQRLAPTEPRRRMDPDFAAGWNSLGLPPIPAPAIEAEYHGAYFCGRQIARLTVQVLRRADEPVQRAVVSFGPQPTSPNVPHGAFVAQGAFDPAAGTLQMAPVKWAAQPAGYPWFGLSGRTTDRGTTFSGQVTDNAGCTQFTLKRAAGQR